MKRIANAPVSILTCENKESAGMGGADLVRRENHGSVAVLLPDPRPVNVWTPELCRALQAELAQAASEDIAAIVIHSAGRSFPMDARLVEGEVDLLCGAVESLSQAIEMCPKPVVVALHGSALGTGLSIALAATARIAQANAQVGFPEVTLGLVPAAGATQRLPRLIGAEQALRMMLTGRPIPAAEGLAMGLLDHVTDAPLEPAALEVATALAAQPHPATRDRNDGLRDGRAFQQAISAARVRTASGHLPAPSRIIDCIEAAQLLPFDMGLDFERAAAAELARSSQAAGLRHVFLAELRAAHFPETKQVSGMRTPTFNRLGVLGALADDIVMPALAAGLEVLLVEPDPSRLVQSLERIASAQEKAVQQGRMTARQRDAEWARLGSSTTPEVLEGCDAIIVGDPVLLPQAAAVTAPGVMIGLAMWADLLPEGREGDIVGFRQGGSRFVEISVGPQTRPEQVLVALALARHLGCTTLRTLAPGGVAARVMAAGRSAAQRLFASGENAGAITAVLADYGLGPLGPQGDGAVAVAVSRERSDKIAARVLSAMANEGARMIEEGVVTRPSDVDFAVVAGGGFARWQGGPMFWADQRGLLILRRDLAVWAWEAPEIWTAAPLVVDLVSSSRHFADLDRV
jgi:3-hydroxyacyl-CoA dehydrogenase